MTTIDPEDFDSYVSLAELCLAAGISYSTGQRFKKAGTFVPAYTFGRLKRFSIRENLARLRDHGAPAQTDRL